MNELDKKILNSLSYDFDTNMSDLLIKSGYGNKNYLVKAVDMLEKKNSISTIKDGRERLCKKNEPLNETEKFVDNYGTTLKNYAKIINGNLKQLEKNMPLVPKAFPLKRIKTREPVIELDKKSKDKKIKIYTFQGKTIEGHAYTWRTRTKPLKYFNAILNSLNRLYQESSAISFSDFIDDDPRKKEYQKKAKTLITDTLAKFELIFKKDGKSGAYAYFYIKNTLYGLIHQIIQDKKNLRLLR